MIRPFSTLDRAAHRADFAPLLLRCAIAVAFVSLTTLAAATLLHAEEETAVEPSPSPASRRPPRDPHDPRVPAGAVRAFIDACRAGDYARAARRLSLVDIPEEERLETGTRLARQFKFVLDQKLWIHYERLSDEPEGELDDDLPPDLEYVGTIANGVQVDVLLERVEADDGTAVWKFAPSTVARIPDLYDRFGYGQIGEVLPRPLFEITFLEIRLVQWLGLILLVLAAYLVSWIVVRVIYAIVAPLVSRTRTELDDRLLGILASPLRFLVALGLFTVGSYALRFAEPVYEFLTSLEKGLALVGMTWIALRIVDVVSALVNENLERTGRTTARAVVPLGRRTVKAFLVAIAFIGLLQNLGFNVTGLIAGLGVGGLAVALAAQKSIENLFGGVTLVADQPVRVGETCRFGDGTLGTVEEIGLRSTRVRTLDRTLVSVPNSRFSDFQLENFARRDRIRLHTVIGLRYETSPDQLRHVLAELRQLLIAHPRVAAEPLRVRFTGFGAHSLDVEVYAMVETTDFNEFCAIREDLFLRFMDVVDRSGSSFAFPSQTLYLGRDGGLDAERVAAAERAVGAWRERGELPFPDFAPQTKSELEDSLDYPPEGSAVGRSSG